MFLLNLIRVRTYRDRTVGFGCEEREGNLYFTEALRVFHLPISRQDQSGNMWTRYLHVSMSSQKARYCWPRYRHLPWFSTSMLFTGAFTQSEGGGCRLSVWSGSALPQ